MNKDSAEKYKTENNLDLNTEASAKTGFNAKNVFIYYLNITLTITIIRSLLKLQNYCIRTILIIKKNLIEQ